MGFKEDVQGLVKEIKEKIITDTRKIIDDMKNDNGKSENFYTGSVVPIRVPLVRIKKIEQNLRRKNSE